MNFNTAISNINKHGCLLVFPVKNQKEPKSLWSQFFPRSKMKWEWDDNGDNRVANMWRLMKKLSDCREVVYSKWYQGRATFFSRELFMAMLALKMQQGDKKLSNSAKKLLEALDETSPLSTKELKRETALQGKLFEGEYSRALKSLFLDLKIVGFGEVEDGAFPSLAVASTRLVYEELFIEAQSLNLTAAQKCVDKYLPKDSALGKFWLKTLVPIK